MLRYIIFVKEVFKIHTLKKVIVKIINDQNFLSLAANLSTAIMGLLSFIILMRMLSIEDFGKWVLFTTPASLVDMLRFGLTKDALVRFLNSPEKKDKKFYLGSSWLLGLISILLITLLLWILILLIPGSLSSTGYDVFCYWYPLFALASLPWNYAWTIFQADVDFKRIFWIRFFNLCSFLIIITTSYFVIEINVTIVVIIYITTNLFTSAFCLAKKWTGLQYIKSISREKTNEILNYGKYSMATRVGSSLLKGADAFIISFSSFMGPASVAIYAIPMKFVELIEIPLNSFAVTAFPKLSQASLANDMNKFKKIFYTYTGAIAYLYIVIAILSFFFNKLFILLLGGANYRMLLPEISNILMVFIVFSFLLPLDRFTGVALDSLNKPKRNFQKIIFMASANILGDIFAVFGLHALFPQLPATTLLLFVALASVLFACVGLLIGYRFLKQLTDISFFTIFGKGFQFYKLLIADYLLKIKMSRKL